MPNLFYHPSEKRSTLFLGEHSFLLIYPNVSGLLKGNEYTFWGDTSVKLFCSGKGSILKGKNLLPLGANSFVLEYIPFQKGLCVQESKQEVQKLSPS